MLFKPELCQAILDGTKTQTRRLVKPGEACRDGMSVAKTWTHDVLGITGHRCWVPYYPKWQVGRTYAIQPGRGKKAVGRIRITKIRREELWEISCGGYLGRSDMQQEGCPFVNEPNRMGLDEVEWFGELWDSINTKKGDRWADNPEVWVLEFECVSTPKET